MGYSYNLAGALIEETYPSGRVVKNVLDSTGDLAIVESRKNANTGFWNYADSISYTASGAVSSLQLGNGRWESTVLNNRLQPEHIKLGATQGSSGLLSLDFTYNTEGNHDNNGNILSQMITVPSTGSGNLIVMNGFTAFQDYTYDSLNRIKSAVENTEDFGETWKQTFTYDRYGNRRFDFTGGNTTMPDAGCVQNVCNPTISSANNRLTSSGWTYDASGNVTADPQFNTFKYDAENKQVKVRNIPSQGENYAITVGEYFYDGDGKRVKKVVPGTGETTIFVYDAAGKQVAEYSTIVASVEEAKVAYLTNDHLGSPRINTDRDGRVISRHDYHPFGEEIVTSQRTGHVDYSPDSIMKQFTGYERDGETDLDFAQARYLSYNLGRFSSPDPYNVILEKERGEDEEERTKILTRFISNPQRWNTYIYVVNNPLSFTDPDGQEPRTINIFLDAGVATPEGLKTWEKWRVSAMKKDKELTIKIYVMNDKTPGTINALMDSLRWSSVSGHDPLAPFG